MGTERIQSSSVAVLRRLHLSAPSHLDLNFTMDFQPQVWVFCFLRDSISVLSQSICLTVHQSVTHYVSVCFSRRQFFGTLLFISEKKNNKKMLHIAI